MEQSFEQSDNLRNAYAEAYAERLARVSARYDDQKQVTPQVPAWWEVQTKLLQIWRASVRIISGSPHQPFSETWYAMIYIMLLLGLLWLLTAFLRGEFLPRQWSRIYRAKNHDYNKSMTQAVQEAVVSVYYRLRYSFLLDEISRKTHKLGRFLRVHPLRILVFGLSLIIVRVAWKGLSPGQQNRGVHFGKGPQYFDIPSHARVARHERSNNHRGSLPPRQQEQSFQEIGVKGGPASLGQAVLSSTSTVVIENTNVPISKAGPQTITEVSKITVTQFCLSTTEVVNIAQVSGRGCDTDLPPFVETRAMTVTERHTEIVTKTANVAASNVLTECLSTTSDNSTPFTRGTEKSTRRGVGGGLVWCNACRQKHCCELPY